MQFGLIDRFVEIEPGERIVAVKAVSLAEEYLSEHFPTFPVLPGVFMLECLTEAAGWLVRVTQGFAHSVVLLESAKGITYKNFVSPGRLLRVEVKCLRLAPQASRFSGVGFCDDVEVVKGRFSLRHDNLASRSSGLAEVDSTMKEAAKRRWSLIGPDREPVAAPS